MRRSELQIQGRGMNDQGSDPGAQEEQSIIFLKAQILCIRDPEMDPFPPSHRRQHWPHPQVLAEAAFMDMGNIR